MGMRPDDFRHLTPAEFEAISSEFSADRQEQTRDRWERISLLASITIQPHVRRKLTPRQLLPLPWDKETDGMSRPDGLTKEERLKRLSRRLGK